MSTQPILIIGGALSGPTAAMRARETNPKVRIILLERAPSVSYSVCGLAYQVSGEVRSLARYDRERAHLLRDEYRIEVRTGVEVNRIEAKARRVQLRDGSLPYSALVYAAGAESVVPDIPGLRDASNVFRFRTATNLRGIMGMLKRGARRTVILGGGFLGVEAADGFLRRGCVVTILEESPQLLARFTRAMAGRAADALRYAGATIQTSAHVLRAERNGDRVTALRLRTGEAVTADIVIVAAGLRPRTGLLREAGARLREDGTVLVDDRCETTVPHLFACGVCVSLPHAVSGRPGWFAQAAQADKTAQVAGICTAGGNAHIGPVVGTAVVRAGGLTLGCAGLTKTEANVFAGAHFGSVRATAPSCDAFHGGSKPVMIELFYHRKTGRVLGAEVAAESGADKRVDVLATAIRAGLTVEQLASLDLAYAPPFSAPHDPVNEAGLVASAQRRSRR